MSIRPIPIVLALCTLTLPGAVHAQAPGVHTPRQHAEPPLPTALPSPMPSLPPPPALAPTERGGLAPWFGGYRIERPGFTARINHDGSIDFSDRWAGGGGAGGGGFIHPTSMAGVMINLDVTDMIMRLLGEDPYVYDKLQILDATRPERIALRKVHNRETMEAALADLPNYLGAVWGAETWPAQVRRQILFVLWDEAAEDGNALIRDGGERARLTIARFIAAQLPAGSQDGYTAAELAGFNRVRRSEAAFAPYLDPDAALVARVPNGSEGVRITQLLAAF